MVDFDLIFENYDFKGSLKRNENLVSKKEMENKEKFGAISKKIKEHPKNLNKIDTKKGKLLTENKGLLNNKKDFVSDNTKKNFIKGFLK